MFNTNTLHPAVQTFASGNAKFCTAECKGLHSAVQSCVLSNTKFCTLNTKQLLLLLIPFVMPLVAIELDRLFQSASGQDGNDLLLHTRIERFIATQQMVIIALTHQTAHGVAHRTDFPGFHFCQSLFESISNTNLLRLTEETTCRLTGRID